jgi:hypothetical protein
LQDGKCEADSARALVVFQRLGAVELLAHIFRDRLVERRLGIGELVGHGIGKALGKQMRRIKFE